ncbi:MAG TPA: hypothetical protein VGF04_06470 [Solirubrobacterales bacterium]|jgi:hypothetical protein
MSEPQRAPVVPLEAGAGPDNPPCPACGEPLFGWIGSRPGVDGPVSRCESCGLGVVGAPGEPEAALRELDRDRRGERYELADRGGLSAWIGGAGWAALRPGAGYLFTLEAARRLLARRDQLVRRARWRPVAGVLLMWQTILNGFTFGHNVGLGLIGRGSHLPARRSWQRRLDAVICVLAAVPALLIALPLELLAAALGRGGAVGFSTELL